MYKQLTSLLGAALVLGLAQGAQAALLYDSAATISGTGLGAVSTILTIQSTGQAIGGSETGIVTFNGTADVVGGVSVKTGASQTLTRTIGSIGLTDAADLRIVFNADQTAGAAITLTDLHLIIDSVTGTELFNSGSFALVSFDSTASGIGKSGAVFKLDAAGVAAANASGAFANANNHIGLSATASPGNAGAETFFIAKVTTGGTTNVPEPTSLALLGSALFGLAALRRRRR